MLESDPLKKPEIEPLPPPTKTKMLWNMVVVFLIVHTYRASTNFVAHLVPNRKALGLYLDAGVCIQQFQSVQVLVKVKGCVHGVG